MFTLYTREVLCVVGEKVLMLFSRQNTLKCALGGGASAFDCSVKKNMLGKLFLVFAKIGVPLACKYVLCTKWNRNISLIYIRVQ